MTTDSARTLAVSKIDNSQNVRVNADYSKDPDWKEFCASIKKEGILTPVRIEFVNSKPVVRMGHRRIAALIASGRDTLRADEWVEIKTSGIADQVAKAAIENFHRSPMTWLDTTGVCASLKAQGVTGKDSALAIGYSTAFVSQFLSVADSGLFSLFSDRVKKGGSLPPFEQVRDAVYYIRDHYETGKGENRKRFDQLDGDKKTEVMADVFTKLCQYADGVEGATNYAKKHAKAKEAAQLAAAARSEAGEDNTAPNGKVGRPAKEQTSCVVKLEHVNHMLKVGKRLMKAGEFGEMGEVILEVLEYVKSGKETGTMAEFLAAVYPPEPEAAASRE